MFVSRVFIIFFAFVVFMAIRQFIKNENAPVISTKAQLVKKRRNTNTNTDANGIMTTNETLVLIFQLDTNSELKFTVERRIFKSMPEFQWGTLTFQGTRFLKFQWEEGIIER